MKQRSVWISLIVCGILLRSCDLPRGTGDIVKEGQGSDATYKAGGLSILVVAAMALTVGAGVLAL